MSHGHFIRAFKEFGVVGTFRKLYKTRTLKFGALIGTDKYGNKYYENRVDYAYGQHRWVEYAGDKSFYQVDPSHVPAEWHGWLHGVTEEPPTARTTGSTWRTEPPQVSFGSSNPYQRNLGGVINAHTPNLSSYRPRGYGLSNGCFPESKPDEELYYTQPGHHMDKRNKELRDARRAARAERIGFTLQDTPMTLLAKEAGRVGLSIEEYERLRDPESPTRLALVMNLKAENVAAITGKAMTEDDDFLDISVRGAVVPVDEDARQYATRIVVGTGRPARDDAAAKQPGTFAAARAETLTPDEEAFLAQGVTQADLLDKLQQYNKYVDSYAKLASINKDARAGLEDAEVLRDETAAKIEKLRGIEAKLATLTKRFDEASVQRAIREMQ